MIAATLILLASMAVVAKALFPVFPNNIVVFPERDFVSIDSFAEFTGQQLTLEVSRGDFVIGSAAGTVSGDVVAFEVNHPGGLCWGDNTDLFVTPDIQPFDTVSMKYGQLLLADMIVQDGHITSKTLVGNTLTVDGFLNAAIDIANIEVRIVNPDWTTTALGRRDARAIVNVGGAALVANTGYSSGVTVAGTSFTATFVFNVAADAVIGDAGAFSISMWQFTDAAGNGQGLTISEYLEVGGPYSGLCPPSATNITPKLPSTVVVSGTTIKWDAAQNIPGALYPFTGYALQIIKPTVPTQTFGYRVDAATTQLEFLSTTFTAGDHIELRTMQVYPANNIDIMSNSFTELHQIIAAVPTLTSTPAGDSITAVQASEVVLSSAADPNMQFVYTVDGSEPVVAGKLATTSIIYTAPIPITGDVVVTVKAVAFNTEGLMSDVFTGLYSTAPVVVVPPPQVDGVSVLLSQTGIVVTWLSTADLTVTSYSVQAFLVSPIDGTLTAEGVPRTTTLNSYEFLDLTPSSTYRFTVSAARGALAGPASVASAPIAFPVLTDLLSVTSARYKANDFRVTGTGTGSVNGEEVGLYYVNGDGTVGVRVTTTNVPAVPLSTTMTGCVAGVCTFTIRQRTNNPPNPGRVFVKSALGGFAGPVAV